MLVKFWRKEYTIYLLLQSQSCKILLTPYFFSEFYYTLSLFGLFIVILLEFIPVFF
jgi:hypothetical protein